MLQVALLQHREFTRAFVLCDVVVVGEDASSVGFRFRSAFRGRGGKTLDWTYWFRLRHGDDFWRGGEDVTETLVIDWVVQESMMISISSGQWQGLAILGHLGETKVRPADDCSPWSL